MTLQDIRARCPRTVLTTAGKTKPLSLQSTFGHRSSRFRSQYQVPTWTPRAASAVLKKQITDLLPEAEEATTTEGLQALSRYEVERRKSSTRGKFLYKGNGRAISEHERKARDKKQDDKLRRQAAHEPAAGYKRPLDDESHDSQPEGKRSRVQLPVPKDQSPQPSNAHDAPERLTQQPAATTNTGEIASIDDASDQLDYRFVDPQNPLEKLNIQTALYYARAHYFALIGEHPAHTSEGSYASQYLQISALFAQKWLVPGELPFLADVGPWNGSFNQVPTPNLPEEVLYFILHPTPALPGMMTPDDDYAQVSSSNAVAEDVPGFGSELQHDTESNDWNDFGDCM